MAIGIAGAVISLLGALALAELAALRPQSGVHRTRTARDF
jgi:hypothetical protein